MKLWNIIKVQNSIKIYFNSFFFFVESSSILLKFPFKSNFLYLKNNSFFLPRNQFYSFKYLLEEYIDNILYRWSFSLELRGVGFKIFKFNQYLAFDLNYSSLVLYFNSDSNIQIITKKTKIILIGFNKTQLNDLIFLIKQFYYLDSYKGKGIFYPKEQIILKKHLSV